MPRRRADRGRGVRGCRPRADDPSRPGQRLPPEPANRPSSPASSPLSERARPDRHAWVSRSDRRCARHRHPPTARRALRRGRLVRTRRARARGGCARARCRTRRRARAEGRGMCRDRLRAVMPVRSLTGLPAPRRVGGWTAQATPRRSRNDLHPDCPPAQARRVRCVSRGVREGRDRGRPTGDRQALVARLRLPRRHRRERRADVRVFDGTLEELREIQRQGEGGPRSETGPMSPHIEEVLLDGSYEVLEEITP